MKLEVVSCFHQMNTSAGNAETSIEFAIDNVLERISILKGQDQNALISEYKEWLFTSGIDFDVLIITDTNH